VGLLLREGRAGGEGREREGRGGEGKGRRGGKEGERKEGREGRGGEGKRTPLPKSWIRPCYTVLFSRSRAQVEPSH